MRTNVLLGGDGNNKPVDGGAIYRHNSSALINRRIYSKCGNVRAVL